MKLTLLLLVGSLTFAYGYNVLCVFPIPSFSHNQLGKGVVDSLLKAGHSVTWVTPYPEKVSKDIPKTLKILGVSEVQKYAPTQATVDVVQSEDKQQAFTIMKALTDNITTTILTDNAVIDTVIKVQFDAVVTESAFTDIMAGFAAVQQVPWIVLCGVHMNPMFEAQVDEIRSVSTVPLMFVDANIPMNLKERAINALMFSAIAYTIWSDMPAKEAFYERLFSPIASARNVPLPPFQDAHHNVSIMFLNSHEALFPTFSLPPNVIQVAGYHIDENPPPLPKDLQDLFDNSKNGVIYFSMGSVVRSSSALKPHTIKALLAKFAALPYTVLWKFEMEIGENLPPNVHVRPWMPQVSILAHPNLKVFITHGGGLSTLEATSAGVPLLAIPVFGDQPANADQAVKAGYALKVTFDPDMADEVDVKLRELLNNPTYKERVKYLSKLFRSRPVPPSKLVSHYIELAIETKGAYHLRSLSLKYTWVERWMLDIILLLLTALTIILAIVAFIIRSCYRKVFGKTCKTVQKTELRKKKN